MNPRFTIAILGLIACHGRVRAEMPTFEKDVLPILTASCLSCHGGLHQRAGLDLRTIATMEAGGKSGPAVLKEKGEASLLWQKIAADEMPKTPTKLSADEKKTIREWLAAGMPLAPRPATQAATGKASQPKVVASEIDRLIDARLRAAKVEPAAVSDDAEFLRRASLDIVGRLPTAERARQFLDSTDADKRAKLIEELLARPEFGEHWGTNWHHWMVPPNDAGKRVFDQFLMGWLAKSLNADRPWNDVVRDVLTASGEQSAAPQIGFMAGNPEPVKAADRARRVFLGVDMECAECHNHPYTQWRQKEDFWGSVAFFDSVRVTFKKAKDGKNSASVNEKSPKNNDKKTTGPTIKIPATALLNVGAIVPASLLGEAPGKLEAGSPRPAFADWVVAEQNPYFARAAVNRWWWHFFGRGFVMPLDNFHDTNPASHPELLDLLAAEFRDSGYSVKHLVRCIVSSKAYGRTSQSQEADDEQLRLFGRMPPRIVSPEVLYDSLTQVLGIKDLSLAEPIRKKGETPTTPRMIFVNAFDHKPDLPDPTAYYHDILQILQLLNTSDLNRGGSTGERLAKLSDHQAIDELYLMTLTRRPTAEERATIQRFVGRQPDRTRAFAMVLWSIMNGAEFTLNH